MKRQIQIVNKALSENNGWLVGNSMTLADLFVASAVILPLQIAIDGGFRAKALAEFSTWAEKIYALP